MENFREEEYPSSGLTNDEPETVDPKLIGTLVPEPVDAMGGNGNCFFPYPPF